MVKIDRAAIKEIACCFLVGFCVFLMGRDAIADEELVFSEDFSKTEIGKGVDTIKGWNVNSKNGATFTIEKDKDEKYGNCLKITHATVQYGFDQVNYQLSPVQKGIIEFDVKISSGFKGFTLIMSSLSNVWLAFDHEGWKNSAGAGEWTIISPVKPDKWIHCKVAFDSTIDNPLIEFYADGEKTFDFEGDKRKEPAFGVLNSVIFQDYGLADKAATSYIDNIKVFKKVFKSWKQ